MKAQGIDYKPELRQIMERNRGIPIKRKVLWNMLGITSLSQDRKMRQDVAELRLDKVDPCPICFFTTKPAGYCLPATQKQLDEALAVRRSYIINECIARAALKTYGKRLLQGEKQAVLI